MEKIDRNVSQGCRPLCLDVKTENCRKLNESGKKPLALDFRSSRPNFFAEQDVHFDEIKLKCALKWPRFSGCAVQNSFWFYKNFFQLPKSNQIVSHNSQQKGRMGEVTYLKI
jgi:hypothetical protein